jgi:hypothetical protein
MVSDPSTPGAYMMREAKELVENNKAVKVKNLLNEILK